MSEVLLNVRSVRVQYGTLLAVDDISFRMHAGELLGMIGPNGAGKTTILRAAAGLQPVTTGSVHVLGYDVSRHATIVGHHLGFAPDTPAVYENLTVVQFLEFIGGCYGLDRKLRRERVDHWLEKLWLSEKRNAKVGSLSRGMRQRLAVARTLIPDPHVVLLDEPAAGLDPAGRVQFRLLLAGLRDQGKAIIVSSHILADLAEYCTHIAIMERGRLRRFGTVDEVASDTDSIRCHYRVVLALRQSDLERRLGVIEGVRIISADGDQMMLEFDRGREAAARLLAAIVKAGLPVAEFHPLRADLEQAYLRTGIAQVD